MARLKIKHIDAILAPGRRTLGLEPGTHAANPDLFSEGLRNRGLLILFVLQKPLLLCRNLGHAL